MDEEGSVPGAREQDLQPQVPSLPGQTLQSSGVGEVPGSCTSLNEEPGGAWSIHASQSRSPSRLQDSSGPWHRSPLGQPVLPPSLRSDNYLSTKDTSQTLVLTVRTSYAYHPPPPAIKSLQHLLCALLHSFHWDLGNVGYVQPGKQRPRSEAGKSLGMAQPQLLSYKQEH